VCRGHDNLLFRQRSPVKGYADILLDFTCTRRVTLIALKGQIAMTPGVDVEAYFHRIGYSGPHSVSLDTLEAMHLHHTRTIPFENLNPFLRWPVRLDLPSLQEKLVRSGRGGYCFEQNLLFNHVLHRLGFRVRGLAARVLWNAAEGAVMPRSHMLLLIDLDDHPYIADVGFGGLTLTAPLRLHADIEQSTPHEPFRLVRSGERFVMQAKLADDWTPLYAFDLQEQFLADYEVTNWYLSNHPSSHFVTGLIAARPDRDCRYALRHNELAVHYVDGRTERRILTSGDELRVTLSDTFRLTVPDAPEVQAAFERVITRAA
jgi:N-hydroxyarylamine O-acetyltransferase